MSACITAALQFHHPQAETVVLREQKIGNCAGDFFCWVRSPGMCNVDDDNRVIAAKVVQSDLVVYLTPVTFGGYSSALKRMVDHLIQNIRPFFTTIDGEIHHQPRYKSYPDLLVIGWMAAPDTEAEAVFRHLAHRNAINLYAETAVCEVVVGSPSEPDLVSRTAAWLDAIAHGRNSPAPQLPATIPESDDPQVPVRRAVLLVGSPRTTKSSSHSLGSHMMAQLAAGGVQTDTIQIYTSQINKPKASTTRRRAALDALAAADLVVLAFPLYVDSLPAPVIATLEWMASPEGIATLQRRPRFAAIANCGFPEAAHIATALAICAKFARQSGLIWAGGLALGGGEGAVHGTPLHELGARAAPLRNALDLAAAALAAGRPIPQEAENLLAKPFIPSWLYRAVGGYGWRRQAKRYGVAKSISRRPYERTDA